LLQQKQVSGRATTNLKSQLSIRRCGIISIAGFNCGNNFFGIVKFSNGTATWFRLRWMFNDGLVVVFIENGDAVKVK